MWSYRLLLLLLLLDGTFVRNVRKQLSNQTHYARTQKSRFINSKTCLQLLMFFGFVSFPVGSAAKVPQDKGTEKPYLLRRFVYISCLLQKRRGGMAALSPHCFVKSKLRRRHHITLSVPYIQVEGYGGAYFASLDSSKLLLEINTYKLSLI